MLVEAPLLVYAKDFCLETDVTVKGLGAIMSQVRENENRHPVACQPCIVRTREKVRNNGIRLSGP